MTVKGLNFKDYHPLWTGLSLAVQKIVKNGSYLSIILGSVKSIHNFLHYYRLKAKMTMAVS